MRLFWHGSWIQFSFILLTVNSQLCKNESCLKLCKCKLYIFKTEALFISFVDQSMCKFTMIVVYMYFYFLIKYFELAKQIFF